MQIEGNMSKKKHNKRKRKTQTTRAYRKREREVQLLLSQRRGDSGPQAATAPQLEALSLLFFHATTHSDGGEVETYVNKPAEEDDDSITDRAASTTYIQIDLSEPPIVGPRMYTEHHRLDKSLLYEPGNTRPYLLPVQQFSDSEPQLHRWQIRMLNRFQEEARAGNVKLGFELITQLQTNDAESKARSSRFVIDATLYRSSCAREFRSVFLSPTPVSLCQGLPTRRCLRMCLKQLRFTEHPQLLEEHRLSQQVEDLYDLYTTQVNNQICDKLRQELQVARHVAACLLGSGDQQQLFSPQIDSQLQQQLRRTQQLRRRYYAEATAERRLLKRLLTEWAHLKELRKQQQYQCTRLQLQLRLVQPIDLDASCSAWKQRFEADLAEVYREQLELYYRRRRLWNSTAQSPTASLAKPPRKPQFGEIMQSLLVQYEEAFQDPEEPAVHVLRLSPDESTLQLHTHTPADQVKDMSRNYYMRVYLDNQFVAQTRNYRLEPDLQVHMNESFGVLLDRSRPEQLNIWLHEKLPLTAHSRRLAVISVPLAGAGIVEAGQQRYGFQVQRSSPAPALRPKLAGDLYLQLSLRNADTEGDCKLDDVQPLPDALRQMLLPHKLHALKPLGEARAKPRPPGVLKMSGKSPLVFAETQLQLCPLETLLGNRRLQLLNSRHQQRNLQTKQLRFVPALEQEIADVAELVEGDGEGDGMGQLLEPGNDWNPIDLHKHRGRKFLQLLYETIASQCVQRAKALQTTLPLLQLLGPQVDELTGWRALWRALISFLTRQRSSNLLREPLSPWQPQPSQAALAGAAGSQQQFAVSLHVVRATGVPVRSRHILNVEGQVERRRSSSSDISTNLFVTQTLMYSNVRPFVTLSYGQRLCRSRAAEGSNPTWNEQLQLQLSCDPSELRDDIKISLFDELIEQQYTDQAADLYQRLQCNWLGEYRVPIRSLLAHRKFEGCIELCMPKVLVGYKRPLIDSVTNLPDEQYPEFKEAVHLWFYLSIGPGCEVTPLQVDSLACAELPELQQFLRERSMELHELLPRGQRFVEPLVCTSQGKRVCLTRLLEPLSLPPHVAHNHQVEILCHFVSLLCPLRSNSQLDACHGFQGVWLDNQMLLDSTWCSVKDMGVLLCNYMLSLGLDCWLVLGMAIPHGESTFVLYRHPESAELHLIAPASGKRYQLQDIFCPLMRVYCLVGTQNIYYNIQAQTRVSMTNFNLNDAACWLPLFNQRQTAPLGGVHKLDYAYKRTYDLQQLKRHIENKIMKKISVWRSTRKTIWNRAFQPRMLRILSEMEKLSTLSGNQYDEPAYGEQLEREYPNYRLYGFTINFPYTNLSAVSELLRSTCIHYNNNAHVEFCVAVHIGAYANDILSVWVFLLSIVPLAMA